MQILKLLCFIAALILTACASPGIAPTTTEASISENSATLGLYQQAQSLLKQGESEQAKEKIERALRIESDNPYLWFQLAHIGYVEQDYSLAREMAKRAKNFAAGNRPLLRDIEKFLNQITKPGYPPSGY